MDDTTPNTNPEDAMEVASSNNDALQLIDLEKTIKTFHAGIQAKRNELKKLKEMVDDTLLNDQVYTEHTELVNEAKRVQKATKDALMNVASVISTLEEMKELRDDMKDYQTHLSDNIMKYYDMAKTDHITMDDGETYVIKTSAKLVKQGTKYTP